MREAIFRLVLEDCQHELLDDSTMVVFFPKLNHGYVTEDDRSYWIFGTSMNSVLCTYYMNMDAEVMYG